ncbi:MAG TPA: GNAT family N-acetyltransferase [Ramlibacter sp.]|uniref:GNAT family N-acetyltransferase n=1 Tax=Ramlibacter sp. TaxID=1917967 RepID=UPI002D3C62AC|nr:GNAT family N-acetyltransferase [Ramlibacter sp.]HZY19610.1 GNAT family N-acetyltransferase [Ramlibacter sp.]
MATAAAPRYAIRLIHPDDGCNALRLGDAAFAPLKAFLKGQAKRYHKANLARTFVVVEEGQTRVVAYATILCTQVKVTDVQAPEGEAEFPYGDFPALRLARLAVDSRLQGGGMGSMLVDFIMSIARDQIMPNAGCRFLILDAKPQSVAFYRKKGFSAIGQVPDGEGATTLMFVDLHRLTDE